MSMRIWKVWAEHQIKSSYDTMRRRTLNLSDLTPRSRKEIASAFCTWGCFMYDLDAQYDRDVDISVYLQYVEDLHKEMCRVGPAKFFTILKELIRLLRGEYRLSAYRECLKECYTPMVFFRPVFRMWSKRHTAEGFRYVHGIWNFLQKMSMDMPGIEEADLEAWIACEHDLNQVVLPPPIMKRMRDVIDRWFPEQVPEDLSFSFSNGATSDAGALLSDKIVESTKMSFKQAAQCYLHGFPRSVPWKQGISTAKMIFVPKNALHRRGISMEPAWMNFLQSGVEKALVGVIDRSLSDHVKLRDQYFSREMCLHAQDLGLATIDLSEASDRVMTRLVGEIFANRPAWRDLLMAARSEYTVLPNGTTWKLEKYAPMGSKVTFPLECIIFSAFIEVALFIFGVPRSRKVYSVFGDDMIVPAEVYEVLCCLLQSCGFKVNTMKSYASGNFREACGVFVYKGVDITLPSYPRKGHDVFREIRDDKALSLFTQAANTYFVYDLGLTRYLYVQACLPVGPMNFVQATYDSIRAFVGALEESACQGLGNFYLLSWTASQYNLKRRTRVVGKGKFQTTVHEHRGIVVQHKWKKPLVCNIMDSSDHFDDSLRYAVMLYRMAFNDRQLVDKLVPNLYLPLEVEAGEGALPSPLRITWVSD